MYLTDTILKDLPFPYFLIDETNHIVSTSLSNQNGLIGQPFIKLIKLEDIAYFCALRNDRSVLNMQLLFSDTYFNYRVYIVPENQRSHLFCYPLFDNFTQNIEKDTEELEKKLLKFSMELNEKKKLINKTALKINEANFSNEYATNLSTLAASMAHEIRNPLTTVKGFLQLLRPHLIELGREEYADIALEEINRANEIIHEFLNAAKPTDHKKSIIHLNKIVRDTLLLFESEAIIKNTSFSIKLSQEDPTIYGDDKQLKQVLVNLIKNALEAIEPNRSSKENKITITVGIIDDYSFINIVDTGLGMTKETINSLFQPFFSTKKSGTGIGLSICKQIIEEHSGEIKIESDVGCGTKMQILLPIKNN
ncbi:ATP-binding protein [Cytobacillus horneckiae]|uniref:histidine kinase n=1 Tax=Cytobacillus horneckiae TaxID=549687 RepID=A0A2N0ZIM9_9BACI|nr:ATP-binding protein [Cytobacillus horneckiae]MEC1157361.1 ATP-binding protein [Cytobacillus horneckiae]MED2935758.1 ATP-binding protein [Cytobacillus horneckiae]PKG29344.1 sensor histidine kinase [Cytobacillus horneckiae]